MRSDSVSTVRKIYGSNNITGKKSKSFLSHFISNLNDPIIKILLGALLLNIIFSFRHSNWPETIGVAAAVLIATLVSTISEYSTCRAAERLSSGDDERCYVRRDGKIDQIPVSEIVVGDIILLSPGMKIPADGVIFSGDIRCDQSAITGEGKEIKKHKASSLKIAENYLNSDRIMDTDNDCLVFKGATVLSGNGEFVVVRTGDRTLYGTVAAGLLEEAPTSPLKKRLTILAKDISFIGYIAAAMVAISYLFNVFFIGNGMDLSIVLSKITDMPYLLHELLCALTLAVSILVVAVPEGLPMMITVVLSSNTKKMLRHGVLVKKMVGIETAGSMSILFTDKTGTLTEGKMAVKAIVTAEGEYKSHSALKSNRELYRALYDASLFIPIEGTVNSADEAARKFFNITSFSDKAIGRIPFASERRFAAAAVNTHGETNTYVRGAPEMILPYSQRYINREGKIEKLNDEILSHLSTKLKKYAGKGARIIASAYVEGNILPSLSGGNNTDMIFCGLIILEDKLRRDAALSVRKAKEAGIKTVMITGDNKETAAAIASECGILTNDDIVLTGFELASMSNEKLTSILPRISVIARALPSDKLRVVKIARSLGYTCGMTGDGINDAPALKAAHVGFAMGSGTDITKEAGDIVITNNSFSSIVRAVLYGRTIFRSIRKFIIFQLTMNLCATAVSFLGPFVGIEAPVTIIQMLWVNIIMDTLGALAFAGESPRDEYMTMPPIAPDARILTGEMIFGIILNGACMVVLSLFFLLSDFCHRLFGGFGETYFLTAFFAFFIFCGIFLSFNSRSPRLLFLSGIGKNKPFLLIMSAVAIIQLMLVYFGGEVFRCTPLLYSDLLKISLISAMVIPIGIIIKIFQKNRGKDL